MRVQVTKRMHAYAGSGQPQDSNEERQAMPIISASRNVTHRPLTAGEPVLVRAHSHSMSMITGYAVVSTSFQPGCNIVVTDSELIDGATNYGQAMELVHDLRRKYAGDKYAYAYAVTLYDCGCRSDGEHR